MLDLLRRSAMTAAALLLTVSSSHAQSPLDGIPNDHPFWRGGAWLAAEAVVDGTTRIELLRQTDRLRCDGPACGFGLLTVRCAAGELSVIVEMTDPIFPVGGLYAVVYRIDGSPSVRGRWERPEGTTDAAVVGGADAEAMLAAMEAGAVMYVAVSGSGGEPYEYRFAIDGLTEIDSPLKAACG